jgi:hypothetical protein
VTKKKPIAAGKKSGLEAKGGTRGHVLDYLYQALLEALISRPPGCKTCRPG